MNPSCCNCNSTGALRRQFVYALLMLAVLALSGCAKSRSLMPAPNVYQGEDAPELFVNLPDELKGNRVDLLYVTDRVPETDEDGTLFYGHGRSHSMAFGSTIVSIEPELSWEALQRTSLEEKRSTKLTLEVVSVEEKTRFPETPWDVTLVDGKIQIDPEVKTNALAAKKSLHDELSRRLAQAPKPEVVVFIHGFNNDFEYAAQTLAELWHFLGREHVPVLYTWPAGIGGLTGYNYDRESGEFTIFHLKNFLRHLADMPEIEKVHLVAHSRGADVLVSAIRELFLVSAAAGKDEREAYRIENLILAAPDLDADVVSQRIVAEDFAGDIGETTIYTSQGDKAIGFARRLFKSLTRLGQIEVEDMSPEKLQMLELHTGISFVELQEKATKTGHAYFHASPEASSDLIMTIRYGMRAGVENGRPLKPLGANFWQIEPGYPYAQSDDQ